MALSFGHPAHPHTAVCHSQGFPKLSERTWERSRWQRGAPKRSTVKAAHRIIGCAKHPAPLIRKWAGDRLRYGRYRAFRQMAPYPGFQGHGLWLTWLTIPRYIVECESGGSWTAYNPSGASGPYQLLGQGAPYPARTWREKMVNHRIAHDLWASYGSSPWVCA